mmetsp:Transcript_15526/g.33632  ORF Transcript_15526/g.33632 Transcript_15526/m.33632 type:complete len:276 (-) Transcript_15526:225-1052(-)|eukprot:CAMPEP_0118932912 /NCGR_PEP_ID=MMETSP1169-20130426/10685_1 /TAXON_ID=36882 /ORGANISM="Pyramimonas obovata, Strain CCMP722" /LENGTH=275 /DNA_ID=CAMNT_0006875617 /DNA_START=133 /DNA_END=960 /DNA_ORIENTATION=+
MQPAIVARFATLSPASLADERVVVRNRCPRVRVAVLPARSAELSVLSKQLGGGNKPAVSKRLPVRVQASYRQEQERYNDQNSEYDYGPPQRGGPPPPRGPPPGRGGGRNGGPGGNFVTPALVAAAFTLGIAAGVGFENNINFEPDNVASREIIDKQTPNSEVCFANGASAMVFDERIFVSLNPFNVYVAQPEVKPGCVLRRSNWSVLEKRELITDDQEKQCKRNLNTFAFVGDLNESPEVSCVYHSEDAENQFMRDPKSAALGDGYQPRRSRDFK